jgi:hypothetical protein
VTRTKTPILDELRAAREKLLDDAGGDLDRLVAGIRQRQAKSGRKVVSGRVPDSRRTEQSAEAADGAVPNGKTSSPAR